MSSLQKAAKKARSVMAAYLEDHPHVKPGDCYATGPKTGDDMYDLVRCPGCCAKNGMEEAIAAIDAALTKSRGEA